MEEAFSLGLEAGGAEEEGIISGKEQPDRKKRLSGYRPAEDSTIRLSACVGGRRRPDLEGPSEPGPPCKERGATISNCKSGRKELLISPSFLVDLSPV